MKTAPWSLAIVAAAGSALATEEDCTDSSAPAYEPSSYAAGYGSSSAPAGYPSGWGSSSAPASYPSAWGSSSAPVYPASSVNPSSYGVPSGYPSGGYSAPSYPVPSGYPSVSAPSGPFCVTTKTCAAKSTLIYRSKTVYPVTQVITTYQATSPGVCPASSGPVGYPSVYPSESVPVPVSKPHGPVIVTHTNTLTKTVCPCEDGKPTRTPGEVYTTETTTEYMTQCPGEGEVVTYTWGDWTSTLTAYESSTVTDTITVTLTEPYPTDPAGYPSGPAGYPSEPAGYPSGSAGWPSGSAPAYPSGSAGWPSGSAPAYPSASGYPSGSASYSWASGASSSSGYYSSSYAPSSSGPASPTGSACVPCQGQPGNDPEKWCGLDIHTNWYDETPITCKTVEYFWKIEEADISPDGVDRVGILVNGQFPGPMIEANWGDTIIVHLTNALPNSLQNGTSLHFHGIRQKGTNEMDGVTSITQCPLAPGASFTYKWVANSYGTSWWHSHYALQTYEGVFGPMMIHGPAAADYDEDQFVLLADWNHATVDSMFQPAQTFGIGNGPLTLDTGLINGMNVWEGAGKRFEMTVQSGKSYRIRLVNTAIQSTFVFYVDGHKFQVIAMDFVPIVPYETEKVVINIGQRYDLIMKADQPSGDYWLRGDNQQVCGELRNLDIKGIVHYADGPMGEPTSQQYTYAPTCLDEPYEKLVPIVALDAGAQSMTVDKDIAIQPTFGNPNLFKWTLSGTTFYAKWENPTLKSIVDDGTIPTDSGNLAIQVPNLGEWVYVIIDTTLPLTHPIHLHGHDFFVLSQGLGPYTGQALNTKNPPRRDVVNMPADPINGQAGYVVIAFEANNPGVWLLHCHIGWHNSMGFALQIIENLDGIKDTVKYESQMQDTCASWDNYASAYNVYAQPYDAGVKF